MTENNRRQAILPSRAHVLSESERDRAGLHRDARDGKFVACMPGVPREMKPMLADGVIPWLVDRFTLNSAIYTKTLHTIGIGESELDRRVEDLFRSLENPKIAMLAHGGRVDVKVMAKAESQAAADAMIAPIAQQLRERIGEGYYGDDEITPGGAIVRELVKRGKTLGGRGVGDRRRRGRQHRRGAPRIARVLRRDRRVRQQREREAARRCERKRWRNSVRCRKRRQL